VITPARARELAAAQGAALPDLRAHIGALLVEGVLSEDYVLQARRHRVCINPMLCCGLSCVQPSFSSCSQPTGMVYASPGSMLMPAVGDSSDAQMDCQEPSKAGTSKAGNELQRPSKLLGGEWLHSRGLDLRSGSWLPQNTGVVLDCLRACNAAVRWLMLAGASRQPALAEAVRSAAPPPAVVVALLLDTSLLEYEVSGHLGLGVAVGNYSTNY